MPEYKVGMYVEWNKEIWEVTDSQDDSPPLPPLTTLKNIKTGEVKGIRWTIPVIVDKKDYVKP